MTPGVVRTWIDTLEGHFMGTNLFAKGAVTMRVRTGPIIPQYSGTVLYPTFLANCSTGALENKAPEPGQSTEDKAPVPEGTKFDFLKPAVHASSTNATSCGWQSPVGPGTVLWYLALSYGAWHHPVVPGTMHTGSRQVHRTNFWRSWKLGNIRQNPTV